MENINWEFFFNLAYSLVGQKVIVDGTYEGKIRMILGGPLEMFFAVFTKDDIIYVDIYDNSKRLKFPDEI